MASLNNEVLICDVLGKGFGSSLPVSDSHCQSWLRHLKKKKIIIKMRKMTIEKDIHCMYISKALASQ